MFETLKTSGMGFLPIFDMLLVFSKVLFARFHSILLDYSPSK
jgi:hypothetical protein